MWKVDWPMRWAFEHVDFEPAGMDHATPGSSFTVGHELVETIFGMPRPAWFGYGFVGFAGVQKMSSSAGGAPTAEDALRVLEAPILRWLYVRRNPKQTFNIDFGAEVVRLYDEWDSLGRKAADPARRDAQVLAYERAVSTSTAGVLPTAAGGRPVPAALLGRRRDGRLGRADQRDRRAGRAPPLLGARTSSRGSSKAMDVDDRVRRSGGPHDRAGVARHGHPVGARRPAARVARPAPGQPARRARPRAADSRGLRRAQARPRHGVWTRSRPTRSRPTRRSSSRSSTGCWSTPSAAPGCRR